MLCKTCDRVEALPNGLYCSSACKQRAYRNRIRNVTAAEIVKKLNEIWSENRETMNTWSLVDAFNAVLPQPIVFDPASTPAFRVKE